MDKKELITIFGMDGNPGFNNIYHVTRDQIAFFHEIHNIVENLDYYEIALSGGYASVQVNKIEFERVKKEYCNKEEKEQ